MVIMRISSLVFNLQSATIRLQIDGIDGESRQLIGDVPDMLKSPLQEMGR